MTVVGQTMTVALIGLTLGIPLGIALGRVHVRRHPPRASTRWRGRWCQPSRWALLVAIALLAVFLHGHLA